MTLRDLNLVNVKDNFLTNIPQVAGWSPKYIGRGLVRYNYIGGIAQTGSNIATIFQVQTVFKLVSVWIGVVLAGGGQDNTGPNTLSVVHQAYNAASNEVIWANSNTAAGSFQAIFDQSTDNGDSAYTFLSGIYTLNTNCPNTDVVYATFEVYFPDWRDYEMTTNG